MSEFHELRVEDFLRQERRKLPNYVQRMIHEVWSYKKFVQWPQRAELLMPGVVRIGYHVYPQSIVTKLRASHIPLDSRSNGPAIASYLLAGGERPSRSVGNQKWPIHHVYDGLFCFPSREKTTWATKEGNHFTQSAGLVAIHPVAEALAHEYSFFAWLLRKESFARFGYDPDRVFCKRTNRSGFSS